MLDILNSLILEFRQDLSNFDIQAFKTKSQEVLTEAYSGVETLISPETYISFLDKTMDNLKSISPEDTQKLTEYYSNIYKAVSLSGKNISIPVQPMEDITKIRPEYIVNMGNDFTLVIKGILGGKIGKSKIAKEYASGVYLDKMKKQLVKTSVVQNSIRDMIVMDSPTVVPITEQYIQTVIIPFTKSYDQDVRDISNIASVTRAKIMTAYRDISATLKTLADMYDRDDMDKETKETLSFFTYTFCRAFLNSCAYITSMIIRKVHYYSYNMTAYLNLYNTINNYFPDGDGALHESVIDANMTDIDDSELLDSALHENLGAIIPYAQKTVGKGKMIISTIMANKFGARINYMDDDIFDHYPYDKRPYQALMATIYDINSKVMKFKELIQSHDMVVDDVLKQSGLDTDFVNAYGQILTNSSDVSYYTSQMNTSVNEHGEVLLSVFNELSDYENYVGKISGDLSRVHTLLEEINDSLDINTGYDDATHKELSSIAATALSAFKDYALIVSKKLIERLDHLSDILNEFDIVSDVNNDEDVHTDYAVESYYDKFDLIESNEKMIFESLLCEYHKAKVEKNTGARLIIEAQEQVPAGNANNTDTPATTGDTNNTGGRTPSSTPKVQTDATQQHADKGANDQNNSAQNANATNQNGGSTEKKNAVQAFIEAIKKMLDKFAEKSGSLTKKNNGWLASIKDSVSSLNYEKTNVTVANYELVSQEGIEKICNDAITIINAVNTNAPPAELTGDVSKAQAYLFKEIPTNIPGVTETSFPARTKAYLTFGKNQKAGMTTFSGQDAKNKVDEILTFCEQYDAISTAISKKIKDLSDAASKKQEAIINAGTDKSGNQEGAQTQATLNNEQQTEKKADSGNIIIRATQDFSGAVLTVLEKKYLDYIKVLVALAPAKNTKPATKPAKEGQQEPEPEKN